MCTLNNRGNKGNRYYMYIRAYTLYIQAVHLAFWPWFKITSGHNSNAAADIEAIPLEPQANN